MILTGEEIKAVLDDWGKNPEGREYDVMVAKAQLKKVVGFLESNGGYDLRRNIDLDIDHPKAFEPDGFSIKFTEEDWQSLLKEVEDVTQVHS